jgi:glycosyltransferase involved in cell wall biosynthesis
MRTAIKIDRFGSMAAPSGEPSPAASSLRVLYLVDSMRVGGKERQICELLKALKNSQVEQVVVTMGPEQFYIGDIERLGIPLLYLLRRVRWDPTILSRLRRILKQFRPHVIYTNSEMAMSYAWPLARLMRIRLVNATIRNAFSGHGPRWQWHKVMLWLADARVANSNAGFASRGLHPKSSGNYVIYNGFDMTRFVGPLSASSCELRSSGRRVVGMIAEFSDYKDFPTFIEAAKLVLARRDDIVFVAVGGGKNLENCKKMVSSSETRIQFTGERRDVESLVQQMDIGVLCTFTEGIPNSIMEFMAAGKPVIVTDGGGSRELVMDGKHGFLVPPSDAHAVAEKILALLAQPEARRNMGLAGQTQIQEHFSLEQLAENTLRMFGEVAGVPVASV